MVNFLVNKAAIILSSLVISSYAKYHTESSNPDKGLFYYHNATGTSDVHRGGKYQDIMRVMISDFEYDDSHIGEILNWDTPVSFQEYTLNGTLLPSVDYSSDSHSLSKRLGMRACCARGEEKRTTGLQDTVSSHQKVNATESSILLTNHKRARNGWRFNQFPNWNNEPNPSWWFAFSQGLLSNVFGQMFDRFTNRITTEGASKNCFDEIATWIQNDYKVSFQIRAAGNCGTQAEKQTIYDALYDIVDYWKERKYRKGCAVMDHEGGGRYELSMSSTSQPAYEVLCYNKEFWSCKPNENGYPKCTNTHSIHDEL